MFRRLDHSNIFLLIAGTYTPLAVNALPFPKSRHAALARSGAAPCSASRFRIFWLKAPRWLYVALYIVLGWAAMLYIVDLVAANVATMVLVIVGGVAYTIGAVFYALKRPNPMPGVFGFHELFHACTVLAFLCHWTAILLIVMNPVYARRPQGRRAPWRPRLGGLVCSSRSRDLGPVVDPAQCGAPCR